jgi:hypothetical protein
MTNKSELVTGALYSHCLKSSKAAGLFLLLTDRVIQPAYYGLECIESLHIGRNETLSPWAESAYPNEMFDSEIMASRNLAPQFAK